MNRKNFVFLILCFLIMFLSKLYFIEKYGVNMPFWDQWDGEALFLYKPYMEGNLGVSQLFAPHNEHRIFLTRIFNLIIFILNSNVWNTKLVMKIQTLIFISIPIFVIHLLIKYYNQKTTYIIGFCVSLLFALPISLENLLWGFQNQFYFMNLFSVLSIYFATKSKSYSSFFIVILLSLLAYLNVAGGALASLVVSVIFFIRFIYQKKIQFLVFSLISSLLFLLLYIMFIPPVHIESLKAKSLDALIENIARALFWPQLVIPYGIFFFWFPIIILTMYLFRKNKFENSSLSLFSLGIVAYVFLQIVGLAYARSYLILSNRYYDIFLLVILAIFIFLHEARLKEKSVILVYSYFICIVFGFYWYHQIYPAVIDDYFKKKAMKAIVTQIYQEEKKKLGAGLTYLRSHQPIPYFDPNRLYEIMTDPTIYKILPKELTGNF